MRIAIIGGGQLGMMMAEEAKKLGHTVVSLDPNPNCSITEFSDCHIAKEYNDEEVLQYLFDTTDVITYEFENVNLEVLKKYSEKIPQKLEALEISRNRIVEKNYAKSLCITTPSFTKVLSKDDIMIPSIIKTTTGGYDGKGQYLIKKIADIDRVPEIGVVEYICEELVEFDYEISVIATRDKFNNVRCFPVPKNEHKNGILHISTIDNSVSKDFQDKAVDYTERLISDLNYVGTLAVEYFVSNGEVIFNEFAPRPHNSGHYTMDGCNISQFTTHILAVTGEVVPDVRLLKKTAMINVLGQNTSYYDNAKLLDNVIIHDYNKNSQRTNRKIGHINVLYDNATNLESIMKKIIEE